MDKNIYIYILFCWFICRHVSEHSDFGDKSSEDTKSICHEEFSFWLLSAGFIFFFMRLPFSSGTILVAGRKCTASWFGK